MKYSVFYHHVLCAAKELGITAKEMLVKIKSFGIDYVELDRNDIGSDEEAILSFKNMLDECGISPSNICGYYNFNLPDTSPEKDDLMIRQAKILGCPRIMVIPGFYSDLSDAEKCRIEKERMIAGTKELVAYAKEEGLTVTVECYDNAKSPISTIKRISDFLEAIPDLYVTLETGNFIYSDEDILWAEEIFRTRIRHVHLKDRYLPELADGEPDIEKIGGATRTVTGKIIRACAVGDGHLPVYEILKRLKNINYDGIHTIEHFGAASYFNAIRDSIFWLLEKENG